jgi:hypothetical protein
MTERGGRKVEGGEPLPSPSAGDEEVDAMISYLAAKRHPEPRRPSDAQAELERLKAIESAVKTPEVALYLGDSERSTPSQGDAELRKAPPRTPRGLYVLAAVLIPTLLLVGILIDRAFFAGWSRRQHAEERPAAVMSPVPTAKVPLAPTSPASPPSATLPAPLVSSTSAEVSPRAGAPGLSTVPKASSAGAVVSPRPNVRSYEEVMRK